MYVSGDKFNADIEYAKRMVKGGYATVEQAAAMCGLEPAALQARLAPATASSRAQELENWFSRLPR